MEHKIIAEDLKVLVFRSNIDKPAKRDHVRNILLSENHIYQVDVDLEDIEHVLRVECHPDYPRNRILERLQENGFRCSDLK